jgi:hypothetical protein
MSHLGTWGLLTPRWSVVRVVPHSLVPTGIWSMAGLPCKRAMVLVGPPLFCRPLGSRRGSVLGWELFSVRKPQVVPGNSML